MMDRSLSRRGFVRLAAAATAAPARMFAEQTAAGATFNFGHDVAANVPLDFMGLSYESPQLANPNFFSPQNKELVAICRELSPEGVLRTGGNLSAFTGWRDDSSVPLTAAEQAAMNRGKKYWEWDLCDPTIRGGNHEAVFTPASIETLAGFLQTTGWKLLYGLNFGTGTPEQAAAEASCVQRLVGKNLLGFQLGNEIDFWAGGLRAKDWDFENYYSQWKEWVRIIRAKAPRAPFAGPDTAIRLDWMEQLAEREGKSITVLTKHHYAMGPAGDPQMNATHLLGPDAEVAKEIASAQRASAFAGIGFRTAECGSCFHGGQPGVSNGFASALWGADYLLTLAQGGHAGINMHGGGEGFYSPITGDQQKGFTRRPVYFGMKLAQAFAGTAMLKSTLATRVNATAFAARKQNDVLIALINKDSMPLDLTVGKSSLGSTRLKEVWKLSAPALDSLTGVHFEPTEVGSALTRTSQGDTFKLSPYTALVTRYS